MSKLIIIRGNSGSGKSTVAMRLQHEMGRETMLISQDVIRRDILRVADTPHNPAIRLIEDIARYGKMIGYDVIVESILGQEKYGDMLQQLSLLFEQTYAFYFDISFEETLRRHQHKKDKRHEFGEKEMKEWWREHDILNIPEEVLIPDSATEDGTLRLMADAIYSKSRNI